MPHAKMGSVNAYYPVMLNLKGRKVLFVGGGWETGHKVKGLLEAGAALTLLSTEPHPELADLERAGKLRWQRRGFLPEDLNGVWLVMSHPIDKAENGLVWRTAEARGVLCNCVDDPERCSLILPSVMRRGDLVLSVSTSGVAPALGVRIKERLAGEFGAEYGTLLELFSKLRPGITAGFGNFATRKKLWYDLVDSPTLELLRQGQVSDAEKLLKAVIATLTESCHRQACEGCDASNCPTQQRKVV